MRIIVDLDGTICELRREDQTYAEVLPKPGTRDVLETLIQKGHTVIIHTARHMKTCNGDVEMVKERIGEITLKWLAEHGIPYHEVVFGKPYGDIYIDDLALRFCNWDQIREELCASDEV